MPARPEARNDSCGSSTTSRYPATTPAQNRGSLSHPIRSTSLLRLGWRVIRQRIDVLKQMQRVHPPRQLSQDLFQVHRSTRLMNPNTNISAITSRNRYTMLGSHPPAPGGPCP